MKIREAKPSDWPNIYRLMQENMQAMQTELGLEWDKEAIQEHYRSKLSLIGEVNHKICGFISYEVSMNKQMIHTLQIPKLYQNKLYGYRLLSAALINGTDTCSQDSVVACCVFENNIAQSQYFALGFKEVARSNGILSLEIPRSRLLERMKR